MSRPTAESILADLRHDIETYIREQKPRGLQVETGASQLYGCVAEAIFRLRGEPSQEPLSWDAEVGTAIHEYLATVRPKVRDGMIVEQRFVFRNVPATVDCLIPAEQILIDYKSDKDADDILGVPVAGKPKWRGQLMVGAAGAREAGYDVRYVAIVLLPRSGDLDDARVLGPWEYDEAEAVAATEWAADADTLALDPDVDPRDHRGMPAFWCRAYCGYAKSCRGELSELPDLDELAPVAADYFAALQAEKDGKARKKELAPLLLGAKGRAGEFTVTTVHNGGQESLDTDALVEAWQFLYDSEPPTKQGKPYSYPLVRRAKKDGK